MSNINNLGGGSEAFNTYRKQVSAWLKAGHSITSKEAIDMFGCTRLSAVIFDLIHDYELPIISHRENVTNRNGMTARISVYYLEEFKERFAL